MHFPQANRKVYTRQVLLCISHNPAALLPTQLRCLGCDKQACQCWGKCPCLFSSGGEKVKVRPGGWNKIYWKKYAFVDKLFKSSYFGCRKTPVRLGALCANVALLTAASGQIPPAPPRSFLLNLFTHAEVNRQSETEFLPTPSDPARLMGCSRGLPSPRPAASRTKALAPTRQAPSADRSTTSTVNPLCSCTGNPERLFAFLGETWTRGRRTKVRRKSE